MPSEPIYLDFQATTPLDPAVFEAMLPWLQHPYNAHAEEHAIGRRAADAIEGARASVATLVGCQPSEITFTSGATEASNIVLRGLGRSGTHIAVSALEHASVAETADALCLSGASVTHIPVDEAGTTDISTLDGLFDSEVTMVSITAVNNEIGTVQPIAEAAAICAYHGVPLHSDITQAAGRIPLALSDWSVAYASMSSHKVYGPQGVGALYKARDAPPLPPLCTGGSQERGLRPGTLPVASCVGFGVACMLAHEQRERDACHARRLARAMLDGLADVDGWRVNGSLDERIPHNLSIAFEDIDADVLVASSPELAMSTGSACSSGSLRTSKALEAIGLPDDLAHGTIRVGFGRTTTLDEVRTAAAVLCERVTSLRIAP